MSPPRLLTCDLNALAPSWQSAIGLLAPGCDAETAAELIRQAPELYSACFQSRVAALVYDRWGELLRTTLPRGEAERWQHSYVGLASLAARRDREMHALLASLVAAGIPVIVLRGPWIGRILYTRPFLRHVTDLDLVLPTEAIRAAESVLEGHGFARREGQTPPDPAEVERRLAAGRWAGLGGWDKRLPVLGDVRVDLHPSLRIATGRWWPWRPTAEFLFARSEPWEWEGVPLRALTRPFALLTQSAHVLRHALAPVAQDTLIMYYDILKLAQALGADEWEAVVEDGNRLHLGLAVTAVADRVAAMWGRCLPDDILARLRPRGFARALSAALLRRSECLGRRGRILLLQACATRSWGRGIRYLVGNALTPRG